MFTPKAAYSQKVWMATWLCGDTAVRSATPTVSPAVTAAMAPEKWNCSARANEANASAVVAMISASGSSVRRMMKLPTSPSTRPIRPPITLAITTRLVSTASEGVCPPATTAAMAP